MFRERKDLYFSVSPCETGLAPHQEPVKCLTLEFNAKQTKLGKCALQGVEAMGRADREEVESGLYLY